MLLSLIFSAASLCYSQRMTIFHADWIHADGVAQMALDEALLEWVRHQADPALITRTYTWSEPTLSLGVHQPERDYPDLARTYGSHIRAVVKRPTGGRAILHGKDVSFAFITNDPAILKQRLADSYGHFTGFVRRALKALGVPVEETAEATGTGYLRSPVCFETRTPSDLKDGTGRKIAGSAQLRRQNGILQHGAAFLKPYGIEAPVFTGALFQAVAQHAGQNELAPFPLETIAARRRALETAYAGVADEIQAAFHLSDRRVSSFSTSMGSHREPASC